MRRRHHDPESMSSLDQDMTSSPMNISQEQSYSQQTQSSTGMSEDLNMRLVVREQLSQDSGASSSRAARSSTLALSRTTRSSASLRHTASTAFPASTSTTTGTSPILSWGTVCVVKRPSTHARQVEVKPYALQNTFYAYPFATDSGMKNEIESKIRRVAQNFEIQRYDTEIVTFGLPFEVDAIGCISNGHGNMAKKFTLPAVNKRKRDSSSESSSLEDSEAAAATNQAARRTVNTKRKKN